MREQEHCPRLYVGIFGAQQFSNQVNHRSSFFSKPVKGRPSHIVGRILECFDQTFRCRIIDLRCLQLLTFARDAIDRADPSFIVGSVAANAGIEPIGYLNGSIRTDGDIRGTELETSFTIAGIRLSEISAIKLASRVRSEKIESLQTESSILRLRLVSKNYITCRLAVPS